MPTKWILEGYFGSGERIQRITLKDFPVKVGRNPKLGVPIVRSEVSRHHAEFFTVGEQLMLKDLGSTNGTFVNHEQLGSQMSLRHGDVLHFASYEVRVLKEHDATNFADGSKTTVNALPLSNKLPTGLSELEVLLDEKAIQAEFQPIVSTGGELFGYEVLGCGSHQDLPHRPMGLFRIAESMPGKDAQLSEIMRDCGVEQGYRQGPPLHRLFMNTHPAEVNDPRRLLASMRHLRETYADLPMVLEIHENAITDVPLMKRVAEELIALDIELAYDDFGAGQARLMEMIEVPVKYVKFDIALIRGLHEASESKQKMVAALVAMTRAMDINALAEGVESPQELQLCREMNFDLIQGYFFGKPAKTMGYTNPLL